MKRLTTLSSLKQMATYSSLLKLVTAFFWFITHSSSFSSSVPYMNSVKVPNLESQKVNLSLYYDTLCPSCANFIVKNLARVFDQDLIDILNLRLVPWGNASINKSNNAAFCQHGADECMLNTLEACSIDVWRDVNKHFALIYCIEFLAIEERQKEWNSCFNSLGLSQKPILDCFKSGNGTKLVQRYAEGIAHLKPPHTVLPWVVVNDQPLGHDYGNFATYVCKAYRGKAIPVACGSIIAN